MILLMNVSWLSPPTRTAGNQTLRLYSLLNLSVWQSMSGVDRAPYTGIHGPGNGERPAGTRIVIKLARGPLWRCSSSTAAWPGRLAGCSSPTATTSPEITALDDYRPQHHHPHPGEQRRRHRRVRHRARRRDRLRRHRARAAAGDHRQPRRRLRTALRSQLLAHPDDGREGRGHRTARRRQHHHAAARPQSVLQAEYMRGGVYARSGREGLERKVKEALPRAPDSSGATPSARSSRCTPTRCRCTAPTAWRPARGCISTSPRRTSRSTKPRPSRPSSRRPRVSARS
jgi:hypothetical protein